MLFWLLNLDFAGGDAEPLAFLYKQINHRAGKKYLSAQPQVPQRYMEIEGDS